MARYVALGSSFAAGPGIEPIIDRRAARSGNNYAHLVAAHLGATVTDATVSGATTTTILTESQRAVGRRFPPQIEAVDSATDLVTITAGGNDLGYLGGLLLRSAVNRLDEHRITSRLAAPLHKRTATRPTSDDQITTTARGLSRIVGETRRRAPRARVVLVDYLPILDAGTAMSATVPLRAEEVDHARAVATTLSEIYLAAARESGAEIVPASSYGSGHGAGSPDPWVNGFSARRLSSSFHPTAAGMRIVADRVIDLLLA